MNDKYVIENHPFETFLQSDTKILVIGTFPTYHQNYKDTFKFYYAGKDNNFWSIIESVFDVSFKHFKGEKAIHERKKLLISQAIGLTDMHQKCYRKNKKSGDEYLYPIILKDIFSLLENFTCIERIVLTSRTDVVGALGLLKSYFLQKNRELPETLKRFDKILETSFVFDERVIDVLVPYSPSPRLINDGRVSINDLVEMYSFCLK